MFGIAYEVHSDRRSIFWTDAVLTRCYEGGGDVGNTAPVRVSTGEAGASPAKTFKGSRPFSTTETSLHISMSCLARHSNCLSTRLVELLSIQTRSSIRKRNYPALIY